MLQVAKSEESTKRAVSAQVPIRLDRKTHQKLERIVGKANTKEYGRRIKASEVVDIALTLINADQIRQLQNQSMSNADRLDQLFKEQTAKNKGLTRDEFLGQLLGGKLTT